MTITEYIVATQENDHEAGYPEYEESATTHAELLKVSERAIDYGVPPHRLTVIGYWKNGETRGHDNLGTLEEVLRNLNKEDA